MKSLEELLDDFAAYIDLPETSCFSLPPDAYLSPDLNALEVRAIFERSWLCVGREEYAPEPGDYYTMDVMGEPVVIVRGTDGIIRALNTACRHRAMPVVTGRGNAGRFVCPYHSWVYAIDGRLVAAPHMEGSLVFSKAECSLPEYRLESWKGFLFVNLDDDAEPLRPSMASMDQATRNYRIEDQTEIFHYETTWNGNWKLSAENSMEYYHHIGLHARTVGVQMPAKGTYFPDHPPVDETYTHERCMIGEKYLGGADHPLNPRGDRVGPDARRARHRLPRLRLPRLHDGHARRSQQLALLSSGRPRENPGSGWIPGVEGSGVRRPGGRLGACRADRAGQCGGRSGDNRARAHHAQPQGAKGTALSVRENPRPVLQVPWPHAGPRSRIRGPEQTRSCTGSTCWTRSARAARMSKPDALSPTRISCASLNSGEMFASGQARPAPHLRLHHSGFPALRQESDPGDRRQDRRPQ